MNYKSIDALLADFRDGAAFVMTAGPRHCPQYRFPVTRMVRVGNSLSVFAASSAAPNVPWEGLREDGYRLGEGERGGGPRLERVHAAPCVRAPHHLQQNYQEHTMLSAQTNKLPYDSVAAIVAAHRAGVSFRVQADTAFFTVVDVYAESGQLRVRWRDGRGNIRTTPHFEPNGDFKGISSVRLRHALPPAPVLRPAEPFLKRYVLGEPAYCPKTREVVAAIRFVPGGIEAELRNAEGVSRVSTNYDHRGKHKWVPERTLVIGEVPPQEASNSTPAKVFVYRETWNGCTRYAAYTRAVGTEAMLAGGTRRLLGILDIPA